MRTLLALIALASPALAQTEKPAPAPEAAGRVQFIHMGEHLIEGAVVRPVGVFIDVPTRAQHKSLVTLRHTVLHKLKDSAKEVSLR